jgi:alpha-1,2-mannosyltransferase
VLVLGALVLIAGGVLGAMWMLHPLIRKWDLGDLAVYRAAGNAVRHGHSIFGSYVHDHLRTPFPFIYPPVAAVFAVPATLLGETQANLGWTALTIVVLGAVVAVCFGPLLRRFGKAAPIAFVLVLASMCALSPVEDHLRFGQVGILLMACCIFDCVIERPRWPRGVLVGVATAIKLVPGLFIPYLWLTGRKRAAWVAVSTFGVLTVLGGIVAPSDSWQFFHSKMFAPTSPQFFTNQSLEGILQRAVPGGWRLLWIVAIVVVLVYGLRAAVAASAAGDELRAVAITGLVSVLVSPISWIHHLVWVVPVIAVIIGAGRDPKRVMIAVVVAAIFVARLPYFGHDELKTGLLARLLVDSYGFVCVALLVYLARGIPARVASGSIR